MAGEQDQVQEDMCWLEKHIAYLEQEIARLRAVNEKLRQPAGGMA